MKNRNITNQDWLWFYQALTTTKIINYDDYSQWLDGLRSKGRYRNIIAHVDTTFPHYNANCYYPQQDKLHIVLEGPAQDDLDHCTRFIECLINPKAPVTDIIVAGDPNDGRSQSRGFLNYFSEFSQCKQLDIMRREELAATYDIDTYTVENDEHIHQYKLILTRKNSDDNEPRVINVYQLASFVDFGTEVFSCKDIEKLLSIYQSAKTLAIHCSAGMGRSGVIELAFMLFASYKYYFIDDQPDFNRIKLCLEQMRALRPALVQTPEQLRMAVILSQQIYLASLHQLTPSESVRIEQTTDAAIFHHHVQCNQKNDQVKDQDLRSSNGGDRYRLYSGTREQNTPESSYESLSFSSDDTDEECDEPSSSVHN